MFCVILFLVCLVEVSTGQSELATDLKHRTDATSLRSNSTTDGHALVRRTRAASGKLDIETFLSDFQSFDTISAYLDQLADQSEQAETKVISQSLEGRDIKVIKIGESSGAIKPIIFIGAGGRGNDTTGPPTAVYVAYSLIDGAKKNPQIKKLLNAFEFNIVAVANPDGYHYARTVDPKWSKSRSLNSRCRGINVNRNWDIHWGEGSTSKDPCSEEYGGRWPYDSVEAHSISNYLLRNKDRIKLLQAIYEQEPSWRSPYGYTRKLPKNYKSLVAKAQIAANAASKVYGTKYDVGTTTGLNNNLVSGDSVDWAFDVAGIPYPYYVVVPNQEKGTGGKISKKDIKPTAIEAWAGIQAMASEILKEHLKDNLRNLNTGCRCKSKPPA